MKSEKAAAPLKKPRARQYTRKNEIVLAAAEQAFVKLGYEGTSVDAIAQIAGVSKRTVYSNFGTKEALYAAVIRKRAAHVVPHEINADSIDSDPEESLFKVAVAFLCALYAPEQVALYQTVVADSRQFPDVGKMMVEGTIMRSHAVFDAYFRKQAHWDLMRFPNLDLAAAQFIALLKTNVHLRLMFNQPTDTTARTIEEICRASIHLFLHGALQRGPLNAPRLSAKKKPHRRSSKLASK